MKHEFIDRWLAGEVALDQPDPRDPSFIEQWLRGSTEHEHENDNEID